MPSGCGLLWNSDALKLHRHGRGNISRDFKEVPFTYHLFFFLTSTTGFPTAIPSHLKKRLQAIPVKGSRGDFAILPRA